MVNKKFITRNLAELNRRYRQESRNPRIPLYYSKLCIIELCGWIEITMDNIVFECASKYIRNGANLKFIEQNVVRPTYGFEYSPHFRRMLIQTVGLVQVERLEKNLDARKFELLKSSLGTLKQARDGAAHTYIKDVTQNVLAPSMTIVYFNRVYEGLKDIENCLRKLKM